MAAVDLLHHLDAIDLAGLRRRRSEKWRTFPPDVLPAFVAEMDYPLAEPVQRALHDMVDAGDCGYAYAGELPEVYAEFARRRQRWDVDPSRVFVVGDVMSGVEHVLWLLTAPGDAVVINSPVYPPFFTRLAAAGRRVVDVPLGDDGDLDLSGLQRAFAAGARAYLLCNPHNPTGRVWSSDDLHSVAQLADRYGVLVIADEVHAPLTLRGAVHTPYLSLGDAAAVRAVAVTSASKAFNVAGLKCAVVVAGSEPMRRELQQLPEAATEAAGLFGVVAAIAAWREGDAWLDAVLDHVDHSRCLLDELLATRLPAVRWTPPQATYLAWLDCRALQLGDDPRQAFLERGHVALARGLDFGPSGAGFVRVTMGTGDAVLREIVARMGRAVEDVQR